MFNGVMASFDDQLAEQPPISFVTSSSSSSSLDGSPETMFQIPSAAVDEVPPVQELNPVLEQLFCEIIAGKLPTDTGPKTDIPIARIKSLMKRDGDVAMLSCEAPQIMSKASALFIADLTFQAWELTALNDRRVIRKEDVLQVIKNDARLDFLYDIIVDQL